MQESEYRKIAREEAQKVLREFLQAQRDKAERRAKLEDQIYSDFMDDEHRYGSS